MILVKTEPLDLRAHGAIEHEDALARRLLQGREHFAGYGVSLFPTRKRLSNIKTDSIGLIATGAPRSHKDIFMSTYACCFRTLRAL